MRPGGSSRPMIAMPVSDLPAPDSPTTPSTSPRRDVEGHVVHRAPACRGASEIRRAGCALRAAATAMSGRSYARPPRHAMRRIETGAAGQRSFGLSASRSQSPSRLTDSTSTTSAMPGNTVIHHSPENRKSLPTRISVPSDGLRRRHADAEEGQRRFGDDRGGDMDGGDHQHRPHARWAARAAA